MALVVYHGLKAGLPKSHAILPSATTSAGIRGCTWLPRPTCITFYMSCACHGCPDEYDSLYRFVDTSGMRCMNSANLRASNCIKPFANMLYAEPYLASHDDDPEMVLFVPFTEVVNITSFALVGNVSHVELYVNRDDVDFSISGGKDVDLAGDLAGEYADYPLRFGSVSSITLVVREAFDAGASIISFLGFKGRGTGIKHRAAPTEVVYESRASISNESNSKSNQCTV